MTNLLESEGNSLKLIGAVSRVALQKLEIQLANREDGAKVAARLGDFLYIHSQDYGLFGRVVMIRMPDAAREPDVRSRIAVIEMLVSLDPETGLSQGGVVHTPAIGDSAYLAPPELIQDIAEGQFSKGRGEVLRLKLAYLPGQEDNPLSFSPEQLFGRHCAIVGATGGGKSWTLARVVEECARFKSKVILLDATGEFRNLQGPIRHVIIGGAPSKQDGVVHVTVPYRQLTEGDLFAIFKPLGESQGPKLRAAMKSLKLARVAHELTVDGVILKAHRSRIPFERAYSERRAIIDSPFADFDIYNLGRQIENECIDPQRSPTEPNIWGGVNGGDYANCMALITRIEDIITAPELTPIFRASRAPSLFDELKKFLEDDDTRVLRISLETFSFAHNAREIVVNALGRHLLDLARHDQFKGRPLLVFLDEAHQFLNAKLSDERAEHPLNSFALIAKEGRKYGLNVCLATQRPRDIPPDVLSQMGTLIVHRITNDLDRSIIERAAGDLDRTAAAAVPMLAPGEAVIIGPEFGIPLKVRMLTPEGRPYFEGPNYQSTWR